MPRKGIPRRPLVPSYVMPRDGAKPAREKSILDYGIDALDYSSSVVRRVLTGSDVPLTKQGFDKYGVPGAFLGAAGDVILDPLNLVSAGFGSGAKIAKGVRLSAAGEKALEAARLASRASLPTKMAERAASLAKSGRAAEAAKASAVAGDAARMSAAAERSAAAATAKRALAPGGEALRDLGGLKVGFPFREHKTILTGADVGKAARNVADHLGLSDAARKLMARPGVVAAGEKAKKVLEEGKRLFSRHVTPHESRMARAEDEARIGAAAATDVAKNEINPEIIAAAKEAKITPEEMSRRIYRTVERPRETVLDVAETSVKGVDPKREKAEKILADLEKREQAMRAGTPQTAMRSAQNPVTTLTSPVARPNPKRAHLMRQLEIAEAQAKALPVAIRKQVEARLAKIRARITAPVEVPGKAPIDPFAELPGNRLEWNLPLKGTKKPFKVAVEVLERYGPDAAKNQVGKIRVRIARGVKGRRGLPKQLAGYPEGSEHIIDQKDVVVSQSTVNARVRANERNSLPKHLRKNADEFEAMYKDMAIQHHAKKTGSELVTLSQSQARGAGPSVYKEWLEARGEALRNFDRTLQTEGSLIKRVNAVEKAQALLEGRDVAGAATLGMSPGPTIKTPKFVSTPEYRSLQTVSQRLGKHEQKFAGRVGRLEKAVDEVPKTISVEEQSKLGRLLDRKLKVERSLGIQGPAPRGPAMKPVPPHPDLIEKRPVVRPVAGPAGDLISQLSPKAQEIVQKLQAESARQLKGEQILAKRTGSLGSDEIGYIEQVLTKEAKDAIDRAKASPTGEVRQAKVLDETHTSQKARKFVEYNVIDERRYAGAHGTKPVPMLTSAEIEKLVSEGIVHKRYMDVQEINRLAQAGELPILGAVIKYKDGVRVVEKTGIPVKEFFSENPALAYAVREAKHQKAMAAHRAFTDLAKPEYGAIRVAAGQNPPEGFARIPAPAGDAQVAERWALKDVAFPIETAQRIKGFVERFTQPQEVAYFLKAFDQVQGLWKGWQLATPGYHIRNLTGDMFSMNLSGLPWARMPRRLREGGEITLGKKGVLETVGGGSITYDDVRRMGREQGIEGGHISAELEQELTDTLTEPTLRDRLLSGKKFIWLELNKRAGEALENTRRYALFAERLAKGETAAFAAETVKKFLFDYGDITSFERNVLKRAFPFITWTRKAIPLYVEKLLKHPGHFSNVMHGKDAVETLMGGQEPDPRFVASWVRDNLGVRIRQDPNDPTKYDYFLLGSWLPQTSIRMLTHPMESAIAQLTPAVRMPYELYSGKRMDTGAEIQQFEGQPGTMMGGTIPGGLGGKSTEYLLRSLSVLNEIDKLVPGQAHRVDRDMISRLLSVMMGARSQRVDVEKGRNWKIYELTKRAGAMGAAYDKAKAGGYESEAEMIRPQLEEALRERSEIGQATRRGKRNEPRPSDEIRRLLGMGGR